MSSHRSADVDWIEMDGEVVLFDGEHLHHLDQPAAAVWMSLDGDHDDEAITADLARRFDADPSAVAVDVADLLRVLRLRGLVSG